jgi:hypothetical protein
MLCLFSFVSSGTSTYSYNERNTKIHTVLMHVTFSPFQTSTVLKKRTERQNKAVSITTGTKNEINIRTLFHRLGQECVRMNVHARDCKIKNISIIHGYNEAGQ